MHIWWQQLRNSPATSPCPFWPPDRSPAAAPAPTDLAAVAASLCPSSLAHLTSSSSDLQRICSSDTSRALSAVVRWYCARSWASSSCSRDTSAPRL